jgi:hypothetical protein
MGSLLGLLPYYELKPDSSTCDVVFLNTLFLADRQRGHALFRSEGELTRKREGDQASTVHSALGTVTYEQSAFTCIYLSLSSEKALPTNFFISPSLALYSSVRHSLLEL